MDDLINELVIVRGISGSGKSTWAREQNGYVVVSRDDLRMALFNVEFGPPIDEGLITAVEHAAIHASLVSGWNVISDNTNLNEKYVQAIADVGFSQGASVRLHEIEITVDEALSNNYYRHVNGGRFVREAVIRSQFERYRPIKISRK